MSRGCRGCDRARELADWVQKTAPGLSVQVIDLAEEPDAGKGSVFGVPTYSFGGKTIFLGNPSQPELRLWLEQLDVDG